MLRTKWTILASKETGLFLKACESKKIFEFNSGDSSKWNINTFVWDLDKLTADIGASSSEKVWIIAHLMDNAAHSLYRTRINDALLRKNQTKTI